MLHYSDRLMSFTFENRILELNFDSFKAHNPIRVQDGKCLFEIKLKNDEMIYAHTDEERDSLIEEHGKNIVNIARVKGLGELEAEVMAETAMNPETRHLIQVTIDDVKKAQQSIDDWMGSDVTNRKEFISTNLNKYIQDALS